MQTWRYLFAASAVLFVVGVVVQILLAGWGVTGLGGQGMNIHMQFGYWLSLAPVIPLILAWPARAGRQTVVMCAVLLVITFVQTLLPSTAPGRVSSAWQGKRIRLGSTPVSFCCSQRMPGRRVSRPICQVSWMNAL